VFFLRSIFNQEISFSYLFFFRKKSGLVVSPCDSCGKIPLDFSRLAEESHTFPFLRPLLVFLRSHRRRFLLHLGRSLPLTAFGGRCRRPRLRRRRHRRHHGFSLAGCQVQGRREGRLGHSKAPKPPRLGKCPQSSSSSFSSSNYVHTYTYVVQWKTKSSSGSSQLQPVEFLLLCEAAG
jgi:hypothetical protein